MPAHRFNRPCLDCGTLSKGNRCPEHQKRYEATRERNRIRTQGAYERKRELYDNPHYRKQSAYIRQTATQCHICGGGYRPDDPWQADHINAGDPTSPLASAHRSCNARRGNRPLTTTSPPPRHNPGVG